MSNIIVVRNTNSGKSIEHITSKLGENFLSVSIQGQGWGLVTEGFDPDDFRKLANCLETFRGEV